MEDSLCSYVSVNTLVSNDGNDHSSPLEILKSPFRQGLMYIVSL